MVAYISVEGEILSLLLSINIISYKFEEGNNSSFGDPLFSH